MSRWRRAGYLASAFASGAAVLGLEVLASRTLAPRLGTGSVAWAALLAVALGSLAVGNLIGGAMSERGRPERWLAGLLIGAACAICLLGFVHRRAVGWAAGLPLLPGALVAAMITQTVPMLLMGALSPLLIKAGIDSASGRWSGAVLACGSGGGIVGALATGIWLLPAIGISASYFGFAALLALTSAFVMTRRKWVGAGIGLIMIGGATWGARQSDGTIQSRYGQIEVRREATRVMLIDGLPQAGIPEVIEPWSGLGQGYLLETALMANPYARHALVIGLGGGLAPRLLASHGIECECVELDPKVVEVARREFGLPETIPVTVGDGRAFLERAESRWDLIVLDVCTSERLAAHCFTVEFMQVARRRLAPGGILAIQLIGDRAEWSECVRRTVATAFENTALIETDVFPMPIGPEWIIAGRALPKEESGERMPYREIHFASDAAELLTDDRFPAEPEWNRVATGWRRIYTR